MAELYMAKVDGKVRAAYLNLSTAAGLVQKINKAAGGVIAELVMEPVPYSPKHREVLEQLKADGYEIELPDEPEAEVKTPAKRTTRKRS